MVNLFRVKMGFVISFGLILALLSCRHDPQGLNDLRTVCFENEVQPIITGACASCHGPGKQEGVFDPSTYSGIMSIVKAGDPANSSLYQVITGVNSPNIMPPNSALTAEQRTLIEVWILQGAKETQCSTTK